MCISRCSDIGLVHFSCAREQLCSLGKNGKESLVFAINYLLITLKTVDTPVHHNYITCYLIKVYPECPWFCPQNQGKYISESMQLAQLPAYHC